jgi:hypothetical protein
VGGQLIFEEGRIARVEGAGAVPVPFLAPLPKASRDQRARHQYVLVDFRTGPLPITLPEAQGRPSV